MPNVFRWNIARREQLGRLVDGEPASAVTHILEHVRHCSARVIAMAGDARLIFVGRSPDALFDYLTGTFANTSWARRIALLNLSLRSSDRGWADLAPAARDAMREQFVAVGLDPTSIATGPYPVALIDLIYSGETFGKLFELLFDWCRVLPLDERAVRRRLRVVGITWPYDHDGKPPSWRTLDWARRFRPGALKSVSVPWWFWSELGNSERKVSRTNPPELWGDPVMARPPRHARHVEGLRVARALYELGRSRAERDGLSAALAEQPAMRHVWCRVLRAELRSASRPKRIERAFSSKQRVRSWRRHIDRRGSRMAR